MLRYVKERLPDSEEQPLNVLYPIEVMLDAVMDLRDEHPLKALSPNDAFVPKVTVSSEPHPLNAFPVMVVAAFSVTVLRDIHIAKV